MHDYVKNLAKVVRAAREEAHLSQAALAEQIGCDERTILNIENDRGNPKFEVLCQIIAYLHIPAMQMNDGSFFVKAQISDAQVGSL